MAHSGHSGGPVLGPRGEIVGRVVWTVGPSALNYLRRDYIIVAGVDQLRPVDAHGLSSPFWRRSMCSSQQP